MIAARWGWQAAFGVVGALPLSVLCAGLMVGLTQVAGVYIGKRFVLRLSDALFNRLVDGMMLIAGLSLLWETLPAH